MGASSQNKKNAEFVGSVAADAYGEFSYTAITFPLDPPKRSAEWPNDWQDIADTAVSTIADSLASDQL